MTVHQLIKILKSWPDKSTEVVLSIDAEGNQFANLDEVAEALMNADGDIVDVASEEDGEEEFSGTKSVLVIYPV
jgi:hypothetical protein